MTQIPVRNPHTGDIDYGFLEPTKSELVSKVSRLRENHLDWSSLQVSDRGGRTICGGGSGVHHRNTRLPLVSQLQVPRKRDQVVNNGTENEAIVSI